ncbi:intron-binding protein aquarius-like protein [Dinothrombium tinctorium]|uniref:RNA helicase aquarius n=1 Tax=Dinothrombium tinctorium TaxID=1965070 RepID=A0A3S4R2J3_9ACAR|nr:intron-binding protein aquarius-like protein [Dinothrombium tinctorium]
MTLTVSEMSGDQLVVEYSRKYWSSNASAVEFDPRIVDQIYCEQIKASSFNARKIMLLEISQYLELYLWPFFDEQHAKNRCYLMSIVIMINEKFRERIDAWNAFKQKPDHFPLFFTSITKLILNTNEGLSQKERLYVLIFLIHCFNSVEIDFIRERIQKYVSLPVWICLSDKRREKEFTEVPKLRKFWNAMKKKDSKLDEQTLNETLFERRFIYSMIHQFYELLRKIPSVEECSELDLKNIEVVHYCEKFLEFLIDLEALLPTRRFLNVLIDDCHVIVMCRKSNLARRTNDGRLFNQLLERLVFYCRFEIDDITGEALTNQQVARKHNNAIWSLQKLVFRHFPHLKKFYLSNISAIDTRENLVKHLSALNDEELILFAKLVNLGDESNLKDNFDRSLILEHIAFTYERVASQLDALNEMPLYPTEETIWDENLVPTQFVSSESCLALPKLNLQFLTLHDYLLRNFQLFRLESTYEIRQDIEAAVSRMRPCRTEHGGVMFSGWARMALAIDSFTIVDVGKPKLGENAPSRVRAEVRVNLNVRKEIKREWESLRKHDVCFLITVEPTCRPGTPFNFKEPFIPQVGLKYVRGCEIEGMLDSQGRLLEEGNQETLVYDTDFRTYRLWLDCNQYAKDMNNMINEDEDVNDTFNIILRRKPKENNFKAVLEAIRDLMNTDCVVPEWLHDLLLGYGDPASANYKNIPNKLDTLDFNDTFLSFDHLKNCFPDANISTNCNDESKLKPPFKITSKEDNKLEVIPYVLPSRGPYPYEQPKKNMIQFIATQVEAIKSGMQPGLTAVVGPPGTGKTDVAVQIISNLYHNFPEQRTLIVTHSNQALNQLFEKIMELDINERHLLRLGHGEEELETEKDFSRYGRVNYVLKKRLELLDEVTHLAKSLEVTADVGYTCETASYFFLYHILSRWEEFMSKLIDHQQDAEMVEKLFPFTKFFEDAPQPLFHGSTFEENLEIAKGCYRHIKKIFTQLDEFKAFEMLRTGSDRSRYLLVREAKIIAMTCTHAALKRRELVDIGFQYDNILMEEAAQILEIETFIPLLLQNPEHGHNRLKRWIMIGDHNQLPPVIKNLAFQKYSNMEQSLYTRFVRLGVPTIDLDAQGRSRPSLCSLYRWRYSNLGDLPIINENAEYHTANPGFVYEYQLINVEDFNGVGESEPVPYFYQNLAEAEFVVNTFMFMRLLGYPAEKITILTTYNGQKHLIRDVISQRCASNPFIGYPHKVTTVDKYQGSQNDYILLSLVRTKSVGHFRDIRRLVVAMSRSRLGLYIFARVSLFKNCFELTKSFNILTQRPQELHLLPDETYPSNITLTDQSRRDNVVIIKSMPEMSQLVFEMYPRKIEQWKRENPEKFELMLKKPNEEVDEQMKEEAMEEVADKVEEKKDEEELGFEKLTEEDTGMEEIEQPIELDEDDDDKDVGGE